MSVVWRILGCAAANHHVGICRLAPELGDLAKIPKLGAHEVNGVDLLPIPRAAVVLSDVYRRNFEAIFCLPQQNVYLSVS